MTHQRRSCASVGAGGAFASANGSSTVIAERFSFSTSNSAPVSAAGGCTPARTASMSCRLRRSSRIIARKAGSVSPLLRSTVWNVARSKRPFGPLNAGIW